jgi:hypothetical protein
VHVVLNLFIRDLRFWAARVGIGHYAVIWGIFIIFVLDQEYLKFFYDIMQKI